MNLAGFDFRVTGDRGGTRMSEEPARTDAGGEPSWQQRALDNLWLLLALGVLIPAVIYLGWGLWELAELPSWGGR
jgi:hypothetical protein